MNGIVSAIVVSVADMLVEFLAENMEELIISQVGASSLPVKKYSWYIMSADVSALICNSVYVGGKKAPWKIPPIRAGSTPPYCVLSVFVPSYLPLVHAVFV